MKKVAAIILTVILLFSTYGQPVQVDTYAATQYVKVEAFIKNLVTGLDISIDKNENDPYLKAAYNTGILKSGDFTEYTGYLTRTDAAVLINRADEYLYRNTVEEKLLKIVLTKRISDIGKVPAGKREDVAKCFAKGLIVGYSNGYYIQNREFRGSGKVSTGTAKTLIGLVLHPKDRAPVSPDGMLIRTTNLPKNADKYDYILACYPNKFYERKFEFMFTDQYIAGERDPRFEVYPVDMKNTTFKTWIDEWPFSEEMDKYLYDWAATAETYLKYLFNVDYRTVDENWIKGLASCFVKSNIDEAEAIRNYYIKHIKANKVVVESSIIAVEPSTLYDDGDYCMRAYVRYRIIADDINVKQNRLLYCSYPALNNLKSGVWREGIFDIRFGSNDGYGGDGAYWAIDFLSNFIDAYNVPVE